MPAPDLVTVFLHQLNLSGVCYMVTGSVASTIYGEPRLTQDIDLVVELESFDIESLIREFSADDYYVPPTETLEVERRRPSGGHFNLLHLETGLRADCHLAGESALNRWGLEHRRGTVIAGETVWLASPEYVIISKLDYFALGGGEKHLDDIARMLRVSGDGIDRSEIVSWLGQLGLEAEWRQALARLESLQGRR